jgi:two-component system CheB/CheR fusion protein
MVGIGASAGGFEAFAELLRSLPEKTGMAFIFIQHLDPSHSSALTEILPRATKIPVIEVTDGMTVQPDQIHVIPPNATMSLRDGKLHLVARTLVRGQHLPIDLFFHSLAEDRGNQAIGVVLSGTASDGTEGCRAIRAGGGITFAQDPAAAKFPSMPRSAISAGCVDFVLPPEEIAKGLTRIGRHPYIAAKRLRPKEALSVGTGDELNQLLGLVRDVSGVDFGLYKQTTLQRRIKRRMVVHRQETIKDYLRFVRSNPSELDELYRNILIHVTGFFRDKEAYEALNQHVFPALFKARKLQESPIRIWIPGCSTGEEAYSIAICLLEFLWEKTRTSTPAVTTKTIQIFATDISESALDHARMGLYTDAAVADISPARLSRFFIRLDGGYQINKSIREMCVFAKQNITKDPPFSSLDLITCRNLLIYLGPELQKRVVPTLHYALKSDGYLMLGGSESLGAFTDHFLLVDKKNKIYQKKRTAARLITYFTGTDYAVRKPGPVRRQTPPPRGLNVEKEVERVLMNRFVPASIVVNDQMEIVQFRGHTGEYLEPAPGHPTFSLSKMAREGLLVDLRTALGKARKTSSTVCAESVRVKSGGRMKEVDLEVIPVPGNGNADRCYVIVFQEPKADPESASGTKGEKTSREDRSLQTRENNRLSHEVTQLRDELKGLIEDHETTTEEFKSANEEVLSANEELQSTNEELETAKEELQSSNEELTTLNEELQNRNAELSIANNDLINLLGNVNIPVVMVGNDMRIRRFTPPAQKLLNLIPADIGRRLQEIRPNLDVDDIENSVQATIDTSTLHEREVHEKGGAWYVMRVRPYKTWDSKIDGAVISFQDIDELKRKVDESRNYADVLIENAREPILIIDSKMNVSIANRAFTKVFGMEPKTVEGHSVFGLDKGRWAPPSLLKLLEGVMHGTGRVDDFEVNHDFPGLGPRIAIFNARRFEPNAGRPMILLSIEDATEQKNQADDLQTHSALLEMANDAIFVRDIAGKIQLWNRRAEQIYGWTKEEALGQPVSKLLKTTFPVSFRAVEQELVRTGYWQGKLVHTRKDGEQLVVESRWSLDRTGGASKIIELNTDITESRQSQEQLSKLSAQLMQTQDDERRRIARDLHDSAGQKLVALKLSLAQNGNSAEDEMKIVDEILQEIRTVSQVLHPPLLEEAGLISATQWLADGFSERAGIKVNVKTIDKLGRFPANVEIALFRVIQEGLNNIHRHSGAKVAQIEVMKRNSSLLLRISDDGHGMKASKPKRFKTTTTLGVGLLGMRERLVQLGGSLSIDSTSLGTTIEAEVPLEPNQPRN